MKTGEKIVYCRSKIGITQTELANRTGIDRGNLSKLEKGDTIPTHLVGKIAKALDVPVEFFVRSDIATPEELGLPEIILNMLKDIDGLSYFVLADQARRDGIDIETLKQSIEFAKSIQSKKK